MLASEKGTIGNVEIRNRIAMAPMISNLCNPDGTTNETHMAYLEERAKGGAGLIITEYTYVDDVNSRGSRNQLGLYSTNMIPKLRRLTERIHSHGARTFIQLVHAGGKAPEAINGVKPMAPSEVDYLGSTPREMTLDDIGAVIESFTRAAKYAEQANFDGVELHGAHGYLLQEFMSPALNKREDKYGGNLENRLRISQEIVDRIREESDIALGIRLSLYEDDADGYDSNYGVKIAETLRGVDYVHFSAGRNAPPGSAASFYDERTHILNRLPGKPGLTTMVVGSVISKADVEKVLRKADFVSVARGMLADAYFAGKVLEDPGVLRPCIRCNQACRSLAFGEVRCTVNPETGMELLSPKIHSSDEVVNIVGAGIKGLEAALVAAKSGMKVILYDRRSEIGGQLLDISDTRKKEEFLPLLEYYERALSRLGVKIVTGKEYTGEGIYCLPDRSYPEIPMKEHISIDSNVFQYHDAALKLANDRRVTISERSLTSMDRARRIRYEAIASDKGIEIVDHRGREFDIVLFENDQYDILKAMKSGREAVRRYVSSRSNASL